MGGLPAHRVPQIKSEISTFTNLLKYVIIKPSVTLVALDNTAQVLCGKIPIRMEQQR